MFAAKAPRLIKGAYNNTLIRLKKKDRHKQHTKLLWVVQVMEISQWEVTFLFSKLTCCMIKTCQTWLSLCSYQYAYAAFWVFAYGRFDCSNCHTNRPYSYSRYQTGTNLQVRLMQESLIQMQIAFNPFTLKGSPFDK